jgi:hypothetical protein
MTMRYKPKNPSEGRAFLAKFCDKCENNRPAVGFGCEIMANSQQHRIDDLMYPKEWVYNHQGHPVCTAYDPRNKNEAPVVFDMTGDLFG